MDRNRAKRFVFEEYCARYGTHGFDIPALIPQVYLHYDPYTRWAGGTLDRQRMDFLLLLDRRRRVVLEVGGVQHYADREGRASPARYAEMVSADRGLRLAGYEDYRFGGHEIADRSRAARCPACGGAGTLEGDDSSDRSYNYEYEDEQHGPVSVWATVTVPADYFSCPTCHLVLDRYDLIEQAGLPTTFEAIDDHPPQEPDYGND